MTIPAIDAGCRRSTIHRLLFAADAAVAKVDELIGVHASGAAGRGSVLTVIADAVAEFQPDHVLLCAPQPRARQLAGTAAYGAR